jgi:hypothetical protein
MTKSLSLFSTPTPDTPGKDRSRAECLFLTAVASSSVAMIVLVTARLRSQFSIVLRERYPQGFQNVLNMIRDGMGGRPGKE